MKSVIGWAVWYEDNLVTSRDTRFEDLPRDGCLCVVLIESTLQPNGVDHTRCIFKGYDYYFRADSKNGYIYACDLDSRERSTISDIQSRYVNPIIIRGKWVDQARMDEVIEECKVWQL